MRKALVSFLVVLVALVGGAWLLFKFVLKSGASAVKPPAAAAQQGLAVRPAPTMAAIPAGAPPVASILSGVGNLASGLGGLASSLGIDFSGGD